MFWKWIKPKTYRNTTVNKKMADRGFFKENLRYHRVVVVCIVFISIWLKYNFNTTEWNYSNGQTKVVGEKVNGKDEGMWTWYYPNGKKQMQGRFINGKRNGIWTVWNEKGIKISESTYKEDKLNGPFTRWNENGVITSKGIYDNDKLSTREYQ